MRKRSLAVLSALIMALTFVNAIPQAFATASPAPTPTPVVDTKELSLANKPLLSRDARIKPSQDTCKGLEKKIAKEKPPAGTILTCSRPGWDSSVKVPARSAYRDAEGHSTLNNATECGTVGWYETRTYSCRQVEETTDVVEIIYPQGPLPVPRKIGQVNTFHELEITVDNIAAPGKYVYSHRAWLNPEDPGTQTVITVIHGPVAVWPGLTITSEADCASSDGCAVVSGGFDQQELLPGGPPAVGAWTFEFTPAEPNMILYEYPYGTFELHSASPLDWKGEPKALATRVIRCDNALPGNNNTKGCVFDSFRPVMEYSFNPNAPNGFPELAQHIQDAQNGQGTPGRTGGGPLPGAPGFPNKDDGVPLTRGNTGLGEKNRAAACTRTWKRNNATAGKTCDEYPMASTREGGTSGIGFSRRMIDEQHNSNGGTYLFTAFYTPQRVIDGDKFYVHVIPCTTEAWCVTPDPNEPSSTIPPGPALLSLDLSAGNRRTPVSGLYDWSRAGYREGAASLPSAGDFNTSPSCEITEAELASNYGVVPDDDNDDTNGLQAAIDAIKSDCSPTANYTSLSRIRLPAGELEITHQIYADADYLVITGAGNDPENGTRLIYSPDENTLYDAVADDGSRWDQDAMIFADAKGGWIWPGRGLFRVQSRGVHSSYLVQHLAAPSNRKDLFEGTVNVHWKAGAKLRDKPGDAGFAAREGETKVFIANNTSSAIMNTIQVGGYINIRAANTMNFYRTMKAVPTEWELQNLHMRQQIFEITGVGRSSSDKWVTIDKPLEYDVPVTSISDGSEMITGYDAAYDSKASPLVDPVLGVGFENLYFAQDANMDSDDAISNYGNMAPEAAMHGIVFKWAVNSFVRNVHAEMVGSHPIVTEEAKNLTVVNNYLEGSWNKGKGGNGYFRGSRVWDSLYAGNTTRYLRHFTFQWSASGNVAIGNSFDSDLNLHGGWERNNLFELNQVSTSYSHRPGSCKSNCGDEGNSAPDSSDWFPIWWAAGLKAVKWSGSSGPNNVFYNNTLKKQLGSIEGTYVDYYDDPGRVFRFGSSGNSFKHMEYSGAPIADWAFNEQRNYTGNAGVDSSLTDSSDSLFLSNVS
ncbi:NucA/NucB deoxyribonuclease domain-containing protein [Streptosporangium sp. NPDC000509]|uniref:NucA/NucB deoxyribonuclease domain-containing protein n=1 Tax=Streptosporangium sp. NPDC000509 TaxID=3366186 RepID=UPI00368D9DCE